MSAPMSPGLICCSQQQCSFLRDKDGNLASDLAAVHERVQEDHVRPESQNSPAKLGRPALSVGVPPSLTSPPTSLASIPEESSDADCAAEPAQGLALGSPAPARNQFASIVKEETSQLTQELKRLRGDNEWLLAEVHRLEKENHQYKERNVPQGGSADAAAGGAGRFLAGPIAQSSGSRAQPIALSSGSRAQPIAQSSSSTAQPSACSSSTAPQSKAPFPPHGHLWPLNKLHNLIAPHNPNFEHHEWHVAGDAVLYAKYLQTELGPRLDPVVSDEVLRAAFLGESFHHTEIWRPEHEESDPDTQARHFGWLLAFLMPNPEKVPPDLIAVTAQSAAQTFALCFNGEELHQAGSFKQHERFSREKELFMEAFETLPDIPGGKAWGGGSVHEGKQVKSFLELIRNTLVAKLVLHCGLHVRTTLSEDEEFLLILVTCTAHEVLCEADREEFPTELNSRRVDPASLEPCTRSFYPLLHWYFRHQPVNHDDPLIEEYHKVLQKFKEADEHEQMKYREEIEFWEDLRGDIKRITHKSFLGYDGRRHDDEEEPLKSEHNPLMQVANAMRSVSSYFEINWLHNKPFEKFDAAHSTNIFDPRVHIGDKLVQDTLYYLFLRYVQLKAEIGLGRGSCLMQQVNNEAKAKGSSVKLKNLYEFLHLRRMPVYRRFELSRYIGPQAQPWEFSSFHAPSRNPGVRIETPFRSAGLIKLVKGIIDHQVDIEQLQICGLLSEFFALDTREKLQDQVGGPSDLMSDWSIPDEAVHFHEQLAAFFKTLFRRPRVTKIRDYYGEQVALYFALVRHFTGWLVVPSIVGILAFFIQLFYADPSEAIRICFDLLYALTLSLWSSAVLEAWKRKEVVLTTSWGQKNIETLSNIRPAFHGVMRRSPIDYCDTDQTFPGGIRGFGGSGRLPRQIASWMLLGIFAIMKSGLSVAICVFRGVWVGHHDWPMHRHATLITGIMAAGQITMFGALGKMLAIKCNRWENYKTLTSYIDNLVAKIFVFEFVNRFNVFFYIAFVKALSEGCIEVNEKGEEYKIKAYGGGWAGKDDAKMCLTELKNQLQIVFLVEVIKSLAQLLIPWMRVRMKQQRTSIPSGGFAVDETTGRARMSHFVQHLLERQNYGGLEVDGTFDDYTEVMIIFGHVTLFSAVFPLAPAIGLLLFVLERRVDGLKLFHMVRRPLPCNAETIGTWLLILSFMAYASAITNTALVVWTFGAFDSEFFSYYPRTRYFLALVLALLIIKALLAAFIPDVPARLRVIEEHHNWLIQKLERRKCKTNKYETMINTLDLSVEGVGSGKLYDPLDFGLTPMCIKRRVHTLKSKIHRKKHEFEKRFWKFADKVAAAAV